jgi:choline dehydrogenase-like flavoprotein
MASDQPVLENRVTLADGTSDLFGMPRLRVRHRYSPRDAAAREALMRESRRIMRRAGALFFYNHHITTFSHSAGTVRFGDDPQSAPLDRFCRLRGVRDLFVTDASFMPTVGGLNPSLTIAANALRVGEALAAGQLPALEGAA